MSQALSLDLQLKTLVKSERKITLEILQVIQMVLITRCYLELGYSSLYAYLTAGIGYSEGAAQRRISAAKLLKQVPELKADLQSGAINLTQVSFAQTAIRQQEKSERIKIGAAAKSRILSKLRVKNGFETKQILQAELPKYDPTPKSLISPSGQGVSVTLNFSKEEWMDVQALLAKKSHQVPDQRIESLLLRWAKMEFAKDAKLKTQGLNEESKTPKTTNPINNDVLHPPEHWWFSSKSEKRRYISVHTKSEIFSKAQDRCQYVSPLTGRRCGSKHFLQTEHKMPLALGGTNEISNLRVFCQSHNFLVAKEQGVSRPMD